MKEKLQTLSLTVLKELAKDKESFERFREMTNWENQNE